MLANVFAKTLRDRWRGWAIASGVTGFFIVLGMAAYQGIDMSVMDTFPEAYRSLLGLSTGMDAGALAISAIYGSYGALTVASMALGMGASAIAGEERKGTLGLLLGCPKSRTHVLVSKMAVLVLLSAFATSVMWAFSAATPGVLDINIGDMNIAALSIHMFASTVFYGLFATAIGAATGNRGAAIGVTVGVLVLGFLGAGLLPMLKGGEDWVKVFPWYYFNGTDPLNNGVDWSHLGILLGAAALLAGVAVVGLNRRDLKAQSVGVTMLDRLRANPLTRKLADKLAGTARVSSIWLKTASEHQIALTAACAYLIYVQLLLGWFYTAIPQETFAVFDQLPESMGAMFALFGGGDVTTPAGWFQIETFGMMAPVMIMIVTISIGANALAGEESRRTMGLLLANPITRSRIIIEKAITMVVFAAVVGVAAFLGTWGGVLIGDMGIPVENIAAVCILLTLLGIAGGALALAIGAATGRKSAAIWGAAGTAITLHLLNSLGMMSDSLAGVQKLSPFYYYLGSDPLNNGMDWSHAAILAVIAAVLFVAAIPLFQRRDIRQRD
ncbi:MAG: ABC transporter permease subunit [Actinomycetota bacterium]|jgi:ABC-2 type transport system permease protein|nr:ABC transporter permease subunit [Actinomycetota bacterium]